MGQEEGVEKERGKLKEEKSNEIEKKSNEIRKKSNETQMKSKETVMVEKENVEEMKDAERRESLAEMMGAEMKGLLETYHKRYWFTRRS